MTTIILHWNPKCIYKFLRQNVRRQIHFRFAGDNFELYYQIRQREMHSLFSAVKGLLGGRFWEIC